MRRRFIFSFSALGFTLCAFAAAAGPTDWTELFDGKTLNGWTQCAGHLRYTAGDGCIAALGDAARAAGPLRTTREFTNFVLELDLRAIDPVRAAVIVRGSYCTGQAHGLRLEFGPTQAAYKPGAWNRVRVAAYGDIVRCWLNDTPLQAVDRAQQGSGWVGLEAAPGPISPGQVCWRNIRIRELQPTLGLAPPPNAIVLFDGRGLDHWAKQKPKEWDVPAGPADWKLVGDALEAVPGAGSIITTRKFGDCRIHLEFCVLGPVNSGVYVQARYEVSLKDSFGQAGGAPCGAPGNFSGQADLAEIPNVAAPPIEWQSLDIEFRAPQFDQSGTKTRNARISVWLNGVPLYENYEITTLKGAAKRLGETRLGPLMLQEHGAPIRFRNIWVTETVD